MSQPSPAAPRNVHQEVGKLQHLGPTERWQVALLLPRDYEDFREPHRSVAEAHGQERALLELTPRSTPKTFFNGAPRTQLAMADAAGETYRATVFGDTQLWEPRLASQQPGFFVCRVEQYQGNPQLLIHEEVPAEWVGRIRPVYPGKPNVITAGAVRDAVTGWLPSALATAARFVETELAALGSRQELLLALGCPNWTLESLLLEAHQPTSPKLGQRARQTVLRLAALAGLFRAHADSVVPRPARPLTLRTLGRRAQAFPYALTDEQKDAVRAIAADLAQPTAMRALLSGDVGSGKTNVFGLVAAASVDAGARVAILLPSSVLAEQVHRELLQWWPDLPAVLVTGEADGGDLHAASLLVGTTALLFRPTGRFDLVVVDEEQKFSVQQKEQLLGYDGHHLTSSATCIPRSQALARYGALNVLELRTNHTPKSIETRLWGQDDRADLQADLRTYLRSGGQLLIVYPLKDDSREADDETGDAGSAGTKWSVANAAKAWEDLYPGRVRALTGADGEEVKSAHIADMREGRAQILIATSLVETGMNLPGLRRVMVVMPERFGLTQLHQLRGRAARTGGEGFCDLYAPLPLQPKAKDRLTRFLACRTGFEVAELDLQLRGCGDLGRGSVRQSGADETFIFGTPLTVELLDSVQGVWEQLRQTREGVAKHPISSAT